MTIAEQMREDAKANQIELVRAAIKSAVTNGMFSCERNGKLTDETIRIFRKEGFVIQNRTFGFQDYWTVNW